MDTLRLDQQHLDDTPVRRGGPRYRRTNSELLTDGHSICPRRWPPVFTQAAVSESPVEQRRDLPDDGRAIRPNLPMARQTYAGDRFIPRRHNFQASYHLLTRRPGDWEDKSEIDYCKQVELLDVTYRREAMRAMMINQECVTGLNQKRILQIFIERLQGSSDSAATRSTFAAEGKWKCAPRKKPLIRSPEKMLNLSTDPSDGARPIDWSCTDVFAVGSRNGLTIYDSNGMVLDGLRSWDAPTAVKWSNDGAKIACTFRTSMKLKLYDSRRKKFLWSVLCCCSVNIYVDSCTNCCICWSHNDRRIVTACSGTLSVFESDTGKLLLKKHAHSANIVTLNFSSNFKYLVSTGQDKCVRIHIWPYLTEWYNIEFSRCVKAVAWHPEVSGLLCIGGSEDASLSLWNINTYAMIDYLPSKFEGRVENLAWNKLSGELVVHWSYPVGNNRHSVMPVLANFERTVDAIPLDKDERLSFLKFNTTHKQLMTYCYDVFSIWNFFGDEKPPGGRCLPLYSTARQGTVVRNFIR